ncbi:MAG: diguanylate cyclase [Sedimenticola sp.]
MKILLIEGNMDERLRLLPHLQKWGHDIICVSDAEESIELIEQSPPRLILLDTSRPDLDEEKLTQQLRQLVDVHVPIVFLVDTVKPEKILSGIQSGCSDYLLKPIDITLLQGILISMERCSLAMHREGEPCRPAEKQPTLDETTGLAGRETLDHVLERESYRCARYNLPIAAIVIGLDHFRNYNEQYGHLAGDKCLRKIAGILKEEINRPTDLVCHYGEDIFTILLSDTGIEGARFVADRVFNTINEMAIPHRENRKSETVSVSIGVASLFPEPCTAPGKIVECAEQAMNSAKQLGRGRIEIFHEE